jgi:hypothetical protein
MNKTIWKMPVPVTGLIRGPHFTALGKRKCEISFSIEPEDGAEKWLSLQFGGVEAYKCTYLASLGSINRTLRTEAYGMVISIEESQWLSDIRHSYGAYCGKRGQKPGELQHLMICFDDGPCYELICSTFEDAEDIQGPVPAK